LKQILKSDAVQRVLAALIAAYVRLLFRFTRWTRINDADVLRRQAAGEPMIVCFWHGRLIQMPEFWDYRRPIHLLGSRHRDGRLILRTVAHFGVRPIIGSSSRGGAQAIREMVQAIRAGASVCIAPDGPRGPRMRAAGGAVAVAKLTGAPIIAAAASSTNGRVLKTWDRFFLALPFGRGVLICADPLTVPADADDDAVEAARRTLEDRLNAITAEADRRCGRTPVEPAPLTQPASADTAETRA
jgi:lysophospholipid acyltransferase (LPLAT)-like uncharacterized protein